LAGRGTGLDRGYLYWTEQGSGRAAQVFQALMESDLEHPIYAYLHTAVADNETQIRDWDAAFGSFLDWLDATGRRERSILVVVGDHGVAVDSGDHVPESVAWVPLVIEYPGSKHRAVRRPVTLTGLGREVLERVGMVVPEQFESLYGQAFTVRDAMQNRVVESAEVSELRVSGQRIFRGVLDVMRAVDLDGSRRNGMDWVSYGD